MKANYIVVENYGGDPGMCKGTIVSATGTGLQAAVEFAKECQKNNGGLWFVCEIKEAVGDKQNPT